MAQQPDPSPAEPGPHRWFVVANRSRAQAHVQRIGSPGYDVVRHWDDPAPDDAPDATAAAPRSLAEALVGDLAQALRRRELSGLYLVAPAPLLHELIAALPADLRQVLLGEHAGDLTQRPKADLFRQLDELRRGEGAERA